MKNVALLGILILVNPCLETPRAQEQVSFLYQVRENDTLSSIAQRLYGTSEATPQIAALNPDLDTKKLHPGQVIHVPTELSAQDPESEYSVAIQRAREMLDLAELAPDAAAARKALDEAEKAIMAARRATWTKPKLVGVRLRVGTFFQVLSAPF